MNLVPDLAPITLRLDSRHPADVVQGAGRLTIKAVGLLAEDLDYPPFEGRNHARIHFFRISEDVKPNLLAEKLMGLGLRLLNDRECSLLIEDERVLQADVKDVTHLLPEDGPVPAQSRARLAFHKPRCQPLFLRLRDRVVQYLVPLNGIKSVRTEWDVVVEETIEIIRSLLQSKPVVIPVAVAVKKKQRIAKSRQSELNFGIPLWLSFMQGYAKLPNAKKESRSTGSVRPSRQLSRLVQLDLTFAGAHG